MLLNIKEDGAILTNSIGLGLLAGAPGAAVGTAVLVVFQAGSVQGTDLIEDKFSLVQENSHEQKGLAKMFEDAH